jgi:hypothetical protein
VLQLGWLWPCPQVLRPDWTRFPRTNPLAYWASLWATTKKSFYDFVDQLDPNQVNATAGRSTAMIGANVRIPVFVWICGDLFRRFIILNHSRMKNIIQSFHFKLKKQCLENHFLPNQRIKSFDNMKWFYCTLTFLVSTSYNQRFYIWHC